MAKVPLRAYNREIETMIDRGQLDEAIAHSHHIFKTFPKHLETYRLLGKAYLEYKRYKEAVDVFSRVLVSAPNDFVANVGMSIIRDEENKLDDAIWHMERAFETQPSNAAIQSELQRLYGRRDGVQPPRIRMTRGALAHMYVQGELYPQAISEIKSVLKEDPGRSDMEALLARACYRSGLKNEAADAASKVLRRYPYCLDANRVLMETHRCIVNVWWNSIRMRHK
jgi:tetratricopeptide (TPR) repeat protein